MSEASNSPYPGISPEDYEKNAQWLRRLARGLISDPAADGAAQGSGRAPVKPRDRSGPGQGEVQAGKPAKLNGAADVGQALLGEVRGLQEPYRATILQRYMQGLPSAEIGRRAGVPEGTIKWRLATARDELRERMDQLAGSRALWVNLAEPARGRGAKGSDGKAATKDNAVGTGFPWGVVLPILASAAVLVGVGKAAYWLYENRHQKAERSNGMPEADSDSVFEKPRERRRRGALDTPGGGTPGGGASSEAASTWELDSGESLVQVRVLDESSEPLMGARVFWPDDSAVFAQSDGQGMASLVFRPLADGAPEEFVIAQQGYASALLRGVPFAGRVADLGSVLLMRATQRTGRVVDKTGEPVAGAEVGAVFVSPGGGRKVYSPRERDLPDPWPGVAIPAATTQADGTFVLEGIPLRPMQIWATAEEMMCSFSGVIEPGTSQALKPVTLRLAPLPERDVILGTIFGAKGSGPDGTVVRLMSVDGRRLIAEVEPDERGKFRFMVRERGDFLLVATDLLDRWDDQDVEVKSGNKRAQLRFVAKKSR